MCFLLEAKEKLLFGEIVFFSLFQKIVLFTVIQLSLNHALYFCQSLSITTVVHFKEVIATTSCHTIVSPLAS